MRTIREKYEATNSEYLYVRNRLQKVTQIKEHLKILLIEKSKGTTENVCRSEDYIFETSRDIQEIGLSAIFQITRKNILHGAQPTFIQ